MEKNMAYAELTPEQIEDENIMKAMSDNVISAQLLMEWMDVREDMLGIADRHKEVFNQLEIKDAEHEFVHVVRFAFNVNNPKHILFLEQIEKVAKLPKLYDFEERILRLAAAITLLEEKLFMGSASA